MSERLASRTTSLLLQQLLEEGHETVWVEFDERYRPVLTALARRMGLGPLDAEEVAQETLAQFVRDYRARKYDPARGRLRSWILGIARNRVIDLQRQRAAQRERLDDTNLSHVPDDERTLSRIWDEECEREIVRTGLRELARSSRLSRVTLEAFERLVLQEKSPEDVANELDITVASVYHARYRCLGRLERILRRLQEAWELA